MPDTKRMDRDLLEKYVAGEADLNEKKQVVEWVKADSMHFAELRAMFKLHNLISWRADLDASTGHKRRSFFLKIASAAAIILFLTSGWGYALYTHQQIPSIVMQTIHVPAGQRVEIKLTDGTKVWLNAGTTFTFPNNFAKENREVHLNGEAYFHVQKENKRPFIVKTKQSEVLVWGTEFNILAYDHSPVFDVSLLEGSVEVKSTQQAVFLKPHQRTFLLNGQLVTEPILDYNYLLWKEGLICFDDESMDGMTSKLELYFDIKIVVENELLKRKKYTGKFRTKDGVEHILRVFQLKDQFVYEKNDDKNLITIK